MDVNFEVLQKALVSSHGNLSKKAQNEFIDTLIALNKYYALELFLYIFLTCHIQEQYNMIWWMSS